MSRICDQFLQVLTIYLRDHAVDKSPPHLSPIPDQLYIVRGDHHRRVLSDVLRHAVVFVVVLFNDLLLTNLERAQDFAVIFERSSYSKEVLPCLYILRVGGNQGTLREREIVDGVEEIGLTATILSKETMNLPLERDGSLFVVPEIEEG